MTVHEPRSNTRTAAGTSIIAKEMRIEGDCVVEGDIRIEGSISGSVKAAGLELAESGSVEGDLSAADKGARGKDGRTFVIAGRVDGAVHAPRVDIASTGAVLRGVVADEANVRGRIEGGIVATRRLVLEETAVVEGDVRARRLALKEGGQVNGTIVMGDRAAQATASSKTTPADSPAADGPSSGGSRSENKTGGEEEEVLARAGADDSDA